MRHSFNSGTAVFALVILTASLAYSEEVTDVTFRTAYQSGRPKTAKFYYNNRAIGEGREAFEKIVDEISKLPPGSSIVWGPNYDRCGACSGAEPSCVPKFLYPDLWDKLTIAVAERNCTLSSSYPGPFASKTASPKAPLPRTFYTDEPPADEKFDAVLDWKIDSEFVSTKKPQELHFYRRNSHMFSAKGKSLDYYGLHLFLHQLPAKSRLLVRITPSEKEVTEEPAEVAAQIREGWEEDIGPEAQRGNWQVAIVAPKAVVDDLNRPAIRKSLFIDWFNYHGPTTKHEEVLYLIEGEYVGRGDPGFDQILATLDELPSGTEVTMPHYEYGGRWAMETFSDEELAAKNEQLHKLFPFAARGRELKAKRDEKKLKLTPRPVSPSGGNPQSVMDWESGDQYASTFVSFGRIVRHDQQPQKPAARLGWKNYNANDRAKRSVETKATYTLNDQELGQGIAGFAKAMERLEKLPEGSVIHVRVCLRTQGPFVCPLIYEGHRHFERTGFEPYVGLFPWLTDIAKRRKLQIEWIPDEQKSCGDCELNK